MTEFNGATLFRMTTTGVVSTSACPNILLQNSCPSGLFPGEISWDGTQFWSAFDDPTNPTTTKAIYTITTSGACTFRLDPSSSASGNLPGNCLITIKCPSLVDGIQFDASDSSIWYSPDGSRRVYHYSTTSSPVGSLLGLFDVNVSPNDFVSQCGTSSFSSGIATGTPNLLYLAAGTCQYIFKYDKSGNKLGFFKVPVSPFGIEGMECDSMTFAGENTDALWLTDANRAFPNPGHVIAVAVTRGTCVQAGGPLAKKTSPLFSYTAKWVCNSADPNGTVNAAAAESIGLVSGEYKTDINVHNPNSAYVGITKRFVMAVPESAESINVTREASVFTSLGPDASFFITCGEILKLLQDPPQTQVQPQAVNPTATGVSCAPSTIVVNQASSCSATVTDTSPTPATPAGTVSFSVTGVTGNFAGSPCSLSGGGARSSCSVSFTATTTGSATITATYVGDPNHGGSTGTTTATVNQSSTPDFNLTASPAVVNTPVGTTGTSTISVTPLNGFSGTVSLSTAVPLGISCSLSPTSITGSGSSTLSCSPATDGSFSVTVTGISGSLSHSVIVIFVTPTINIVANPSSLTIPQGGCASKTITVTSINNFNGQVTLATNSLGSGLTASFAPTTVTVASTQTGTATKKVCASSTTPPGIYHETIIGTGTMSSTTGQHPITKTISENDTVIVLTAKGFVILTTPASNLDVVAEYSSATTAGFNPAGAPQTGQVLFPANTTTTKTIFDWTLSTTPTVMITITYFGFGASPLDVQADSVSQGTLTGSNEARTFVFQAKKVTLTATTAAAFGASANWQIQVQDTNGETGISLEILQIPAVAAPPITSCSGDFAISANPATVTVPATSSQGNSSITLTSMCGFTGTILFGIPSISLPSGAPQVTLAPSSVTIAPGGTGLSILTVTRTSSTVHGTYVVTITATGAGTAHSVSVTFTV